MLLDVLFKPGPQLISAVIDVLVHAIQGIDKVPGSHLGKLSLQNCLSIEGESRLLTAWRGSLAQESRAIISLIEEMEGIFCLEKVVNDDDALALGL